MTDTIKALRLSQKLTQEDLAARIGTTQQQIQRLERGERKLTYEWIIKLAKALDVLPSVFFNKAPLYQDSAKARTEMAEPVVGHHSSYDANISGAISIPVYGTISAGDIALLINANGLVETLVQPGLLQGVKDGFAILVSSNAMIPRYMPGEYAAVHPHKKPRMGEDCLLLDKDDRAILGVYQREDEAHILLSFYHPQRNETFDRDNVKGLFSILGRF